ncbi:MAG: PDGLE domain-containing protein [Candidatus Thorarchaeota archaeon]
MDRKEAIRYGLPLTLVIIIVSSVIVLGVASQNPDGFEWSLFDFAGISEPEGGFEGIWAFLGEGVVVDLVTGIIGIVAILILGYALFWMTSRKAE